jgi:hypothetical protein
LEGFWLRPDLAALQAGSPMGTSQLIGFFRFLFEIYVTNLERQRPGEPHTVLSVQLPAVQPAVQAWLKRRHRPLVAVSDGLGPHVKSAELHGYEYLRTAYGGRDQQGRGTG